MPVTEDKNGRVKWLAEQLVEKEAIIDAYGLSRDQVIGNTCYKITHHLSRPCHHTDSNCPCPMEDSVGTGNSSHVEHVHQDRDGKTLYLEIVTYIFSPRPFLSRSSLTVRRSYSWVR